MRIAKNVVWLCLAAAPLASVTAKGIDAVVRERQADMKAMSLAAKSISDYFSGKKPYDFQDFRAQAMSITVLSDGVVAHFSSIIAANGSRAREEIGVERVKFKKLADDLSAYAKQMAVGASDGETMPSTMRMRPVEVIEGGPFVRRRAEKPDIASYSSEHAFHMMLQTCASCHAAYRISR